MKRLQKELMKAKKLSRKMEIKFEKEKGKRILIQSMTVKLKNELKHAKIKHINSNDSVKSYHPNNSNKIKTKHIKNKSSLASI